MAKAPRAKQLLTCCEVYARLAQGFWYPEAKLRRSLEDGSFVEGLPRLLVKPFISALSAVDCTQLELEYQRLFLPSHEKNAPAPPYETAYTCANAPIARQSQELADIAGFYRAFGLEASQERPDHISLELEFMHALCLKESHALSRAQEERAEICAEAQRKFINEHLSRWVFRLSEALQKHAKIAFYPALVAFTTEFVTFEVKRLGAKPK